MGIERSHCNQKKSDNLLHIFLHPKFNSTLYPEDDIVKIPMANRYQVYAQRIIEHWESKGLRKPQKHRRDDAYGYAISDLVAVLKGQHPKVRQQLTVDQLFKAVDNWALAVFDTRYSPSDKRSVRALDIPRFIYSPYLDRSYLLEYLNTPKTLIKEHNPKLTEKLMSYYSQARWGTLKNNTDTSQRYDFVLASNRLDKYLTENSKNLTLGLSPKNPDRAAFGLIQCASKSTHWQDFDTFWLSNDWSFKWLTQWLKDQGFFKFNQTAVS